MTENKNIWLSFDSWLKDSEQFTVSWEITQANEIPISDLSTWIKLSLVKTKDFVDFTIWWFSISETQKVEISWFCPWNKTTRVIHDINARVIKIRTWEKIFLVVLHQMFSKTLPSYILHMLEKSRTTNETDEYTWKYIIISSDDFKTHSKWLTIWEKTVEALEKWWIWMNFNWISRCTVRV